jgi:hypothetical protein
MKISTPPPDPSTSRFALCAALSRVLRIRALQMKPLDDQGLLMMDICNQATQNYTTRGMSQSSRRMSRKEE